MNRLRRIARDVPFIILLVNGISFISAQYGWYFHDNWWIEQITGLGILAVLYMAFFAYLHKHCLYTFICLLALLCLNILNIVYFFLPLAYYETYAGIIIFSGISFAGIKWKQQRYYKKF